MRGALLLAVAALAAVALTAGCFDEVFPVPPGTGMAFICAVLDRHDAKTVALQSWVGKGVDLERQPALDALRAQVEAMSGRDDAHVKFTNRTGPPEPKAGWNESTVQTWSLGEPYQVRSLVNLRILWVDSLGDGNLTGMAPAPGTIALSQLGIERGAAHLGIDEATTARIVLLHFAGHALGVVNQGIPVQDPDLQEREGPASHEPDPASVMNVGWEDARTMTWAPNATYDAYSAPLHADWAAALLP